MWVSIDRDVRVGIQCMGYRWCNGMETEWVTCVCMEWNRDIIPVLPPGLV